MTQGFGAFGKMPAMGDFFHLNAPPGFVRVWDSWLQNAMMTTAATLGEAWDSLYMSAPIWRFALSPGVAGTSKSIGILMPSVDRVGRRFPLAVMAAVPGERPVAVDHLNEDATFEKIEDVALAALDDGMDRDRLEGLLTQIEAPRDGAFAPLRRAGRTLVITQDDARCGASDLAAGLLNTRDFPTPSLWSTVLDGKRRTMICDGLPDAHQARALFDLNAPLWGDARPPL